MSDFADLDARVREVLGKPLLDCTTDDLVRAMAAGRAEIAEREYRVAAIKAAMADAQCGCPVVVAKDEGGEIIPGLVHVAHECGRAE